jgi:hypothetical protein
MMRLPFESVMARDLLCANISVPTSAGVRKLSIATSHLESEHRRKDARRQQLEVALKFLRRRQQDTPTAIYCGDMNLNGSECSDLVTKYGWIDAWLSLHPQRGGDRAGVTMDTRANGMLAAQPRNAKTPYQVRLDRIWIRTASGERQTSGSGAAGAALGEKSAEQAWKPNAAAKPAAAAAYGPTPMAITPTAAASSAGSSTSSAVPEWLLLSVERIGLCAIDLRQPQKYAEKNYKAFDTPASTSAQAAAAMFAPPAAAASAPMMPRQGIHGFGSLAAAAASSKEGDSAVAAPPPAGTVVFPSDHFGLLAILQVNEQE